jgi:hypothetical protein
MRQSNQLVGEDNRGRPAANVLLAAVLLLVTTAWLIAYATGKLTSMIELLHPYLPGWFSLVNALLVPVTGALAALRSVPFRANFLFVLVMLAQASLLGLTMQDHPVVKAAVTIFLYYEAFILIPRWNHRIVETAKGRNVLSLQQPNTSANNQEDRKTKG